MAAATINTYKMSLDASFLQTAMLGKEENYTVKLKLKLKYVKQDVNVCHIDILMDMKNLPWCNIEVKWVEHNKTK